MKTWLWFIALAAVTSAAASTPEDRLHVSGSASLEAVPAWATVKIGASRLSMDPDTSLNTVNDAIHALEELCAKFDISPQKMQTTQYRLDREYEHRRDTAIFKGYLAEATIAVVFEDLSRLNDFVSQSYDLGNNEIMSVDFELANPDSIKQVVADMAMQNARRNAEALVRSSGRKLGAFLNASYEKPDDFHYYPKMNIAAPRYTKGAARGGRAGRRKLIKVFAGRKTVKVTVYAVYALE